MLCAVFSAATAGAIFLSVKGRFWDQLSAHFWAPTSRFSAMNVRKMEEGSSNSLGTVCCSERDPSMYIRMRVLPWVTLLLAWGRFGSISAPFGEPASRLLVQLQGKMEEGKIATQAQFGATERTINVYKNACATE
jgi:hypothetical protein